MFTRRFPAIFLLLAIVVLNASSEISVIVFSKEEGLHEHNISKPRIIIENTGNEPISDFYCLYFFTAEYGNSPVLEDYYTPNESVSLQYLGHNRYAVLYDFTGVTLYPGQILPDPNGNVIGIHYPNWEPLSKDNDRSCNFSNDFAPNRNIELFCADGYRINGREFYGNNKTHVMHRKNPKQVSIQVDININK